MGAAFQQGSSHAAALRTVALTGQHAPGTDSGVNFDTIDAHLSGYSVFVFRGPVLNDTGQVAFRANLIGSGVGSTNKVGVWSEGSGNLGLVARTGSVAPGGGTFGTVANVGAFFAELKQRRPDRVLWRPHQRQCGSLVGGFRQPGTGRPRGDARARAHPRA